MDVYVSLLTREVFHCSYGPLNKSYIYNMKEKAHHNVKE